ncbi:MAG: tetratricopeptide repeat protein [Candidatus Poribacteria bacterium]|nr:tetratricopeptide repeat protein [Candidatus Poribacteria bacterium]
MANKKFSKRLRNEIGMVPFPPLPGQPINLPQRPSRNLMPVILGVSGIIGSVGMIALLILVVPWQSVSTALTVPFQSLYAQVKQIKLPQIDLPQRTQPTQEILTEEAPAIEEPPPPSPSPKPDPNFLIGRYPVRRYTDIRHTILATDYISLLAQRYRSKIYPKKYRRYQALAPYNRIRPPKYVLITGAEFLVPTASHVIAPKTGHETELRQLQSELANLPNAPELLNRLAVIHFKRNELEEATTVLQQGLKSSPDNGMLHNNLGFLYLILEEDAKAEEELAFAVTHSAQPAIPRCNLGILYMETGKLDSAIEAFENALEADTNLLDAKYNLALAYEKVGKLDLATKHLHELAQILPEDAEVQSALERLKPASESE